MAIREKKLQIRWDRGYGVVLLGVRPSRRGGGGSLKWCGCGWGLRVCRFEMDGWM